ncbi:hypothetical protein CSIRO_3184 [Bradyrhizobiaceae bacterium SG-6C]|nr:hypothetical protein CSIRO_3184 [Bradyrhizobiaceae bacterium SG-6C]
MIVPTGVEHEGVRKPLRTSSHRAPVTPQPMPRIAAASFCAALIATSLIALATPVNAQIGNIFSDRPRPPANIQRGEPMQEPEEEEVPDLPPQGRILPTPNRQLPPGQGAPPPANVQSQPLPPPPGSPQPAPNAATANPLPGLPPGQKQPRGAPPSPATLQPGDEVVTEPPSQKIVNKQAVFAGLDKITGRIIKFDAEMGETVQFGALRIKPQACYTRPTTEAANTDAFVEVDEITLQGEVKRIFSGWMFAASPGLHGVEHPIYDIWLTDCKGPSSTVAQQEKPKAAPPPPPPPQQPKRPARPPAQRPLPPPNPFPPFQR